MSLMNLAASDSSLKPNYHN